MALTKIDDRGLKTPIDLLDSEKIRLGTGNDLAVYHNGTDSIIDFTENVHNLRIMGNNEIRLEAKFNELSLKAIKNAAVELYHDNSKKFETTNSGASVIGQLDVSGNANFDGGAVSINAGSNVMDFADNFAIRLGNSQDLAIYHNGSGSFIVDSGTGDLHIRASDDLKFETADGSETYILCNQNSSVDLYHDNSKKLETTSAGVQVTGGLNVTTTMHIPDGSIGLQIGNSNDLLIFHDGSNSYIKTTNTNTNLILEGAHGVDIKHGGENMAKFRPDSSVELYYDNTKKFETTSDGAAVDGYLQIHSLPAVSYSDTREIALTNADLTRSNFYNHTNFESDSTILDSNGHFVAPVHGIYRLYVRISTDDDGGNRANIRLRKNGTTVNEAYATQGSSVHQSVSSEIICELNQGQYLDVQVAQMHTMVGSQHKVVNFHMLG